MSRKLVLILVFLMLLVILGYPRFQQNGVRASDGYPVHNLNTGLNYTTIQEAINANETVQGNTILLDQGTYYGQVIVNKSISIIGTNRNTTIIDGNFTSEATILIMNVTSGVQIHDVTIKHGNFGIECLGFNTEIRRSVIIENSWGFEVLSQGGTVLTGNDIENNSVGLSSYGGNNITIIGNTFAYNSGTGISLGYAGNGINIWSNNFINNTEQVFLYAAGANFNSDYPIGGNYWSDYRGTDRYSGPVQDQNGSDGIGDTPYINQSVIDHYPLMGTFQSFNVSAWDLGHNVLVSGEVDVIGNSTVEQVQLVPTGQDRDQYLWRLHFTILCENDAVAFYRITFPNDLLNSSNYSIWTEYQNPTNSGMYYVNFFNATILQSNGTYTIIYFTFHQPVSNYTMDVDTIPFEYSIPEFPSFLILPLFMIAASLAVIVYKRRPLTRA